MSAVALAEAYALTSSLAEEVQFGSAGLTASKRSYINYVRVVQREYTLDALVIDDTPDREHLVNTTAFAGNDRTAEYLEPFLFTFLDPHMHINHIADLEVRDILFKALTLDQIQKFSFHFNNPYSQSFSRIGRKN